jgi:hypothetical protein
MQRLLRDIDETLSYMDEKLAYLNSQDLSNQQDLAQIASLQRKHDAFERSLLLLGDKVEVLERETARLAKIPSNARSTDTMNEKMEKLSRKWADLNNGSGAKRQKLENLLKLYEFLADFRDLMVWYDEMGVVLGQDEPHVKDISTVEVLIERNGEYKRYI